MRTTILALTTIALLTTTIPADAQTPDRWAVELRANGAMATQELQNDPLDTGFGFEATVRYRFLPHLAAYAGWDWIRFQADQSFAGNDMDFEETGYAFGLRFEHPIRGSATAGWVRAGGTYDHLEVENTDGDILADSGHGLGWEVGAGVATPLRGGWSITPGVRYRSLREAVFCGGFYPLSNEEDGILARSLARYRPFRTPFLDNRMVELALRLPAAYHLRRDVVSRAVDRLAPELAALPDASTGLPLSTSMPVRFVGGLANALRRKVSPWATPPRPYLDHGPWLNLGELVRHDDWFERRLRRRRDRVEGLPFLSWDGAVTTYEDHLAGTNRTSELQTLLTLLELPVTEQVVATTQ